MSIRHCQHVEKKDMALTQRRVDELTIGVPRAPRVSARLDPRPIIAMIAHDHEKVRLVDFAVCYRDILSRHRLLATATTRRMLADMVGLDVALARSGMAGGDRQVAEAVAGRAVAAVIFLVDAFSRRPHEPEVEPVMK